MKKLFAIIALVAFFVAVASPAIAASNSAPIAVKITDDKPKKAKSTTKSVEKEGCSDEKKAGCETKGCGGSEKK